jgi:hypothetical protein
MEQTELTVVNALLKVIGEAPVNQINLGHPDVVAALNTWKEYSSEIQSNGWWFNTETWDLVADTDGNVTLPSDVISINGPNTEYIKKGRYLYDMGEHSYDFSEASTDDLSISLITEWSIDELPPVMFNYILSRSKLSMLVDLAYDQHKERKLEREVEMRYFLVQKTQLRLGKPNAKSTSTAAQLLNTQPTR